jgi:uncharacterized membrane protein YhaH (DUF805 family)
MRRWPPIVWPAMSFASLLLLMGLGSWDPVALFLGIAIAVGVFAASLFVATRRLRDRPAPGLGWLLGALGAFYAIAAIVAATAGPEYAVAAMLASLIPCSAARLLFATARSKTEEDEGRRRDASADDLDSWPGIGVDDATPLGDTPEHSEDERVSTPRRPHRGR